jgi:hypothetical protein
MSSMVADAQVEIDPHPLPSITEETYTGHGGVFAIVSWVYAAQDNLAPDRPVAWDVFFKGDKWDSDTTAWAQALGRSISLGVQQGTPLGRYIRTLAGIRCAHPFIGRSDKQNRTVESLVDGIALALHAVDRRLDTLYGEEYNE